MPGFLGELFELFEASKAIEASSEFVEIAEEGGEIVESGGLAERGGEFLGAGESRLAAELEEAEVALGGEAMEEIAEELATDEVAATEAGLGSRVRQNAKTFGKFIIVEGTKGAVFFAGIEAVKKVISTLGASPHATPAQKSAANIVGSVTGALSTLRKATDHWHTWLKDHFSSADTYGTLVVEDDTESRYEKLSTRIFKLDGQRNAIAKKLTPIIKKKDAKAFLALVLDMKKYADAVVKISKAIETRESLMKKDGLKSYDTETQGALDKITKAA